MEDENIRKRISKMTDLQKGYLNESLLKLIDSTEQTSNRRLLINSGFYLIILTTLLAGIFMSGMNIIRESVSILGIVMGTVWILNIDFHAKLNSAKFEVIEIISEELIGLSVYHLEYERLKKKSKLTNYERIIPITFIILFTITIFLPLINMFI